MERWLNNFPLNHVLRGVIAPELEQSGQAFERLQHGPVKNLVVGLRSPTRMVIGLGFPLALEGRAPSRGNSADGAHLLHGLETEEESKLFVESKLGYPSYTEFRTHTLSKMPGSGDRNQHMFTGRIQ